MPTTTSRRTASSDAALFVARYNTPRTRRRLLIGLSWLVGLGAVWLAVTAYLARQQASTLETRVGQVKQLVAQGRVDDARRLARTLPAMADRVHRLTTGPAWWLAAQIPVLGDPAEVTRTVAAESDNVAGHALPLLVKVATALDPNRLRVSGSTVRLAPLVAARPQLNEALSILTTANNRLTQLAGGTWLDAVDSMRSGFAAQLASVRGYVEAAERTSRILPSMLGAQRPMRYFIGLQNEAELRGTGGIPGAFSIAVADKGTLRFTRFESDTKLLPPQSGQRVRTGLDFGAEYGAAYGASGPTSLYLDSNSSPDFPYAARIWAAMWEKVSGQKVDGAVALDPAVLGYFLAAVGPVDVGGRQVNSGNVVSLTQKDEYVLFPNLEQRKQFNTGVLRATSKKLISGAGSAVGILQAASRASGDQRLLVWSRDATTERILNQSHFAGTLPSRTKPFAGLVLNNAASGKLDYYLTRELSYLRTGCGPDRDVVATIALTNMAPSSGLPAYVTTRFGRQPEGAKVGDNRVLMDYYATSGALLQSVTLNGKPSTVTSLQIGGHKVFRVDLELPRGQTQTLTLHLKEPAAKGRPVIWRQPAVTSLKIENVDQRCDD